MKNKEEFITKEKAELTPAGGVFVGKKDGQTIIHDEGTMSGYLVGKLHKDGGIKAVNKATGQPLEMQGGEIVITAPAVSDTTKREFEGKMMTNREILSKINSDGGGVSFADGGDIPAKIHTTDCEYKFGGKVVKDTDIAHSLGMNSTLKKGKQQFSSGDTTYDVDAIYNAIKKGKLRLKTKEVETFPMKYPMYDKNYAENHKIDFRKPNGITVRTESGEEVLIDGNHRMNNAYSNGRKTMKTYYIEDPKQISKFSKKNKFELGGENKVAGRLSSGKSLKQIAEMHNVSLAHINEELAKGLEVEKEHFTDFKERTRVAKDHLVENPNYYTILAKAGLKMGGHILSHHRHNENLAKNAKSGNTPARDLNNYNDIMDLGADEAVGGDSGLAFAKGGLVTKDNLKNIEKEFLGLTDNSRYVGIYDEDELENGIALEWGKYGYSVSEEQQEQDYKMLRDATAKFNDKKSGKLYASAEFGDKFNTVTIFDYDMLSQQDLVSRLPKKYFDILKKGREKRYYVAERIKEEAEKLKELEAVEVISKKLGVTEEKAKNILIFLNADKKQYERYKNYNPRFDIVGSFNSANFPKKTFENAEQTLNYIQTDDFANSVYMSTGYGKPISEGNVTLYDSQVLKIKYNEDSRPYKPDGSTDWNNRGRTLDMYPYLAVNVSGKQDFMTSFKKGISDFVWCYNYYVLGANDKKKLDEIDDLSDLLKFVEEEFAKGGVVYDTTKPKIEKVTIKSTMYGRASIVGRNASNVSELKDIIIDYVRNSTDDEDMIIFYVNDNTRGSYSINLNKGKKNTVKNVNTETVNAENIKRVIDAYTYLVKNYDWTDFFEGTTKGVGIDPNAIAQLQSLGVNVNQLLQPQTKIPVILNNSVQELVKTPTGQEIPVIVLPVNKDFDGKYSQQIYIRDWRGSDWLVNTFANIKEQICLTKVIAGKIENGIFEVSTNIPAITLIEEKVTKRYERKIVFYQGLEALSKMKDIISKDLPLANLSQPQTTAPTNSTKTPLTKEELFNSRIWIGNDVNLKKKVIEKLEEIGIPFDKINGNANAEESISINIFGFDFVVYKESKKEFDKDTKRKEIFPSDLGIDVTTMGVAPINANASTSTQPFDFYMTKIDVSNNPDLSLRVQQKAFEDGWEWENGGGKNTKNDPFNYMYFTNTSISFGNTASSFNNSPKREITEQDIFGSGLTTQTPVATTVKIPVVYQIKIYTTEKNSGTSSVSVARSFDEFFTILKSLVEIKDTLQDDVRLMIYDNDDNVKYYDLSLAHEKYLFDLLTDIEAKENLMDSLSANNKELDFKQFFSSSAQPFNLANTKIWIGDNPELSKRVQEKAFELGWNWGGGQTTVKYQNTDSLFFSDFQIIAYSENGKDWFNNEQEKEIFASDLGIGTSISNLSDERLKLLFDLKQIVDKENLQVLPANIESASSKQDDEEFIDLLDEEQLVVTFKKGKKYLNPTDERTSKILFEFFEFQKDFDSFSRKKAQELLSSYIADESKLYTTEFEKFEGDLSKAKKDLEDLKKLLPAFQQTKFAPQRALIINEIKKLNNKITKDGFIFTNELMSSANQLFTAQGLLKYYFDQTTQSPVQPLEPPCNLPTPNGMESKLPISAYFNVRTKQFKSWFGDWEKAYETNNYFDCSKMIDEETKEPKIYYHGVRKYIPNFGQFSNMGQGVVRPYGSFEPPTSFPASFFADSEEYAKFYGGVAKNMPKPSPDYEPFIYKVFLSVKNPLNLLPLGFEASYKDLLDYLFVAYGIKKTASANVLNRINNDMVSKHPVWVYVRNDISLLETIKEYGYDALIQIGDIPTFDEDGNQIDDRSKSMKEEEFLTFYPTQVKSATVLKSFYLDFFKDIRFNKGGYVRI